MCRAHGVRLHRIWMLLPRIGVGGATRQIYDISATNIGAILDLYFSRRLFYPMRRWATVSRLSCVCSWHARQYPSNWQSLRKNGNDRWLVTLRHNNWKASLFPELDSCQSFASHSSLPAIPNACRLVGARSSKKGSSARAVTLVPCRGEAPP